MYMKNSRRELWYKIALCTAGYGMMSDNVILPMVRAIFSDFSNTSQFLQNFIISGAGMFAVVTGLLTGILMKKVSKRNLLIVGTILFTVGGCCGGLSTSAEFLAVTRLIDSASDGVLTAVTATIIVNHWKTEREQSQMLSLYNLTSNIFGIIMSLASGYLTVINWRYAFFMHIVTIISPILCIIFVYDDKEELNQTPDEKNQIVNGGAKFPLALIIGFFLIFCLAQASAYMPSFLIDLIVAEKGLGNSVVSGWLNSALTFSGIVSYAISSQVLTKMKIKNFGIATFACIAGTLFIYAFTNNVFLLAFAQFCNGFFGSWLFLEYQMIISKLSVNRSDGFLMSVCTSSVYINSYIATYVPTVFSKIFGDMTISHAAAVAGIFVIGFCAVFIVLSIAVERYGKEMQECNAAS